MIAILDQFFTSSNHVQPAGTKGRTKRLFKHHTTTYVRSNFYSNRVISDLNSLLQLILHLLTSYDDDLKLTVFTVIS